MATKKIFISYDYDHDKCYKNLLIAWSRSPVFPDFYINKLSVTMPVDSDNAGPIKRAISQKLNAATGLLCIVSEVTHNSDWVGWEVRKAVELGKRIIAAKTGEVNTTPAALHNVGATWASSFTFEGIKKAVDEAYAVLPAPPPKTCCPTNKTQKVDMPRSHGSTAGGGSFDSATVELVWRKGRLESNFPGIGRDCCGALLRRSQYGMETPWGWEIDHIQPVARGGTDDLSNLQPLQRENNRLKGDMWPWSPSDHTHKKRNECERSSVNLRSRRFL